MALAWKACWVNALASSNLASSAINPADLHESAGFFDLSHEVAREARVRFFTGNTISEFY